MAEEWNRFSGKDGRETEVRFRSFQEGDEQAFKECIESYYGDGYPYKDYFQEDYLRSRVKDGRMVAIVGENRKGEIVSTSAARADTEFKGSVLLLLRVVSPAFQGMGIASAAEAKLFHEIYKKMAVCSFYADVITQNNYSQRTLEARDYITCGFRFCLYRAEVMIPTERWRVGQHLTQVIMCHRAGKLGIKRFYCPPGVRASVGRLYEQLGVSVRFLDQSEPATGEKTEFTETFEADHESLVWCVHQVGNDYASLLEETRTASVFVIYVNLCSPGARELYLHLLAKNFFYSGIKPLGDGEEYLIMTSLDGVEIDREDIHLTDYGSALLHEILQLRKESNENGWSD